MADHRDPRVDVTWEDVRDGGQVARVVVNNPTRLNVMGTQMSTLLADAIHAVSERETLRVLILTGAGDRAFIGGADIKEFAGLNEESARAFITKVHEACDAIRRCPVPVIARIDGYCLGAGLEVAASCDLRAASTRSTFGMPEVKVGVPSVIEAALLPRLIGWGKTNELLLCGENIDAVEAEKLGLLETVAEPDALDSAVQRWVDSIVEAAPQAVRLQKELIGRWDGLSLQESIELGIDYFARAYRTDEPREYTKPFFERKKD